MPLQPQRKGARRRRREPLVRGQPQHLSQYLGHGSLGLEHTRDLASGCHLGLFSLQFIETSGHENTLVVARREHPAQPTLDAREDRAGSVGSANSLADVCRDRCRKTEKIGSAILQVQREGGRVVREDRSAGQSERFKALLIILEPLGLVRSHTVAGELPRANGAFLEHADQVVDGECACELILVLPLLRATTPAVYHIELGRHAGRARAAEAGEGGEAERR